MSKLKDLEWLFNGRHFDREVIVICVRWYLRADAYSGHDALYEALDTGRTSKCETSPQAMPAARLAVVVQSFQLWRLPLSLVTLDDALFQAAVTSRRPAAADAGAH